MTLAKEDMLSQFDDDAAADTATLEDETLDELVARLGALGAGPTPVTRSGGTQVLTAVQFPGELGVRLLWVDA